MTYNDENELTLEESAALAALPRERQPGDVLEERVVRALRAEGHFESQRRARDNRGIMTALRIAAAIALFAGGVATGRYLLAADGQQSASVAPPSTIVRDRDTLPPRSNARQVNKQAEQMVTEREMWL
jgi:anti-sigma factor RsiW